MDTRQPQTNLRGARRRAFTMIELLTVIAIIAILAALLFPVFGTIREQARQSNTMSNLQAIYQGARLFYEDEGRYPSALFGYAETPDPTAVAPDPPFRPAVIGDPIIDMDKINGAYATNTDTPNLKRLHQGYLYKEQIKDYVTFVNANNQVKDKKAVTVAYYPFNSPLSIANGATIDNNGVLQRGVPVTWEPDDTSGVCTLYGDRDKPNANYNGKPKLFYIMDSMDIGPMVTDDGYWVKDNLGNPVYELHYSPDWTRKLGVACDVDGAGKAFVTQLKYRNPPTDRTVLTYVTQHAAMNNPNVLVLLLSGTARKINVKDAFLKLPLNYQ